MFQKTVRLTAFLPPTPCTQEMREKVAGVAKQENVSMAEITRAALSLFLSSYVENSDKISQVIQQEETA